MDKSFAEVFRSRWFPADDVNKCELVTGEDGFFHPRRDANICLALMEESEFFLIYESLKTKTETCVRMRMCS